MNKCKCVVVGDGSVGKTCMLISYTKNQFPAEYVPTVFDNYCVQIDIDDEEVPDVDEMQLDLWDTAGQEDYNKLRPLSYEEADVFVICFSTVERSSFDNVRDRWFPEIKPKLPEKHGRLQAIIVGTKIDLRDGTGPSKAKIKEKNPVKKEEGEAMAEELGIRYKECSALTQNGLSEVFGEIVNIYLKPGDNETPEPEVSKRATSLANIASSLITDEKQGACKCSLM